ncbi:uncharacterized protein [Brachyistius frenatus]|uniref:uncharacterized protein isoform X1 n=1 Tax=Brachyistius frenatus TaxID=100188 RepID=UPI0037E8AAED
MGNAQSYVTASLSACSVYLLYVYVYRAHEALKTNVLQSDKLPSFLYLYGKYLSRALTRREGHLCAAAEEREVIYTVLNCRLQPAPLRSFCSAAGYGWDYPDTEYRDVPLCFPEFLCCRLLLMLFTDGGFRLSPAGLVRVRQSLKTLQPIDELKKGPFTLQVRVLGYRRTGAGVEVDVRASATSRSGCPVWESVLTLLSENELRKHGGRFPDEGGEGQADEPAPEDAKQVELRVPRTAGLRCAWSFSDFSPQRLLAVPARFFGFRTQTALSLWMLSVCLAEVEKHKGVEVITAPVSVTVHFQEPLSAPGEVTIRFWETTRSAGEPSSSSSSSRGLGFHMQQRGRSVSHLVGRISRSSLT